VKAWLHCVWGGAGSGHSVKVLVVMGL
jgi:hypothetical protein